MAFKCLNGTPHSHETVAQARACWGRDPLEATAESLTKTASEITALLAPVTPDEREAATPKQIKYILDLGGLEAEARAKTLHRADASKLIGELLDAKRLARAQQEEEEAKKPPVRPAHSAAGSTSKLAPVLPMLDMIPDGYYAVQDDDSQPITFLRLSRKKNYEHDKPTVKFQTVHGSGMGSARLEQIWVQYPSGHINKFKHDAEDLILSVMADSKTCARRYAREIGRCCRCNAVLTDEKSRRYGIGPECIKHMPWMYEETLVDENEDED